MLIPVIPLPEKSQKECSLSKQLIQDLDYSIPLKVGSHDPIFSSNYSSAHFLRQQLDV